jgi:very-long-chain (3R)-3-hydroxyacyl-CoA dehydratase
MEKVVNVISLAGWSYLLLGIGMQLFADRDAYLQSDISSDLCVLRWVQAFQAIEIVLILIGKSKGSVVGAFFQILGRNILTLAFMSAETDRLRFATVVIIWSMADINRYLYYLFKDNLLTGFLRYNSFLLLYPAGVYGEMLVINDFIKINSETLSDGYLYAVRGIQASIIIGMLFLYKYMLNSRKRYLKGLEKKEAEAGATGVKRESSKSPRK